MTSPIATKRTSIVYISIVALAGICQPSTGWSQAQSTSYDPPSAEMIACDNRAAQEAKQAQNLSPIAPTSFLNPILLLNNLNRRKQEEANHPQVLQSIELERQQCRRNAVAASAKRSQETLDQRNDAANGYRRISFETFALDAKILAAEGAKVSIRGAYLPDGNAEWLSASQGDAVQATMYSGGSTVPKIPLLTNAATRDFRKSLLRCKSVPGSGQMSCPVLVLGYVSLCTATGPQSVIRDVPCIIVGHGRE